LIKKLIVIINYAFEILRNSRNTETKRKQQFAFH